MTNEIDDKLIAILRNTVGKTGFVFLDQSITHQRPQISSVMMEAMRAAYEVGKTDAIPQCTHSNQGTL